MKLFHRLFHTNVTETPGQLGRDTERAFHQLNGLDISEPRHVEIQISASGTELWVNTPHGCALRIRGIGELIIKDLRREAVNEDDN